MSGVLATVVAGLIAGRQGRPRPVARRPPHGPGVWDIAHLPDQRLRVHAHRAAAADRSSEGLDAWTAAELVGLGPSGQPDVIVARIVWVFPATYMPRRLSAKIRAREPYPPPQSGLRRGLGRHARRRLAGGRPGAAARLPGARPDHLPRLLRHRRDARRAGPDAALAHPPARCRGRLEPRPRGGHRPPGGGRGGARRGSTTSPTSIRRPPRAHRPVARPVHARGRPRLPGPDDEPDEADQEQLDHLAIRLAVVDAQRDAIIQLRDEGIISDEVLRRVERDLDLEAVRSGV